MANIYNYDFDLDNGGTPVGGTVVGTGGTPPTLWVTNGSFVYNPLGTPHSGSFSARHTADGTAYPDLQDGASGDSEAGMWFNFTDPTNAGEVGQLINRMTTAATDGTFTGYNLIFNCGTTKTLTLYKRIAGTTTDLGGAIASVGNVDATTWYQFLLKCQGTTISVRVQRSSTSGGGGAGTWLKSDGTWWTDAVAPCISQTNADITGQGRMGVRQNGSGNYVDDVTWNTVGATVHNVSCVERASSIIVISD